MACQLSLGHSNQGFMVSVCYGLAAAGNTSATGPPLPRRGAEANGKKQAETGGSG